MISANGYNRLRWDCLRRGCFNLKRSPKIEVFAACFPGRIHFGDVDGIVEINGNALLLEWKSEAHELPTGQRMLYERLTQSGLCSAMIIVGDAETMIAVATSNPMEVSMGTMTLTKLEPDATDAAPVPMEVLAGGRPTTPVILALDLGLKTGWAVRNRDGAIASGTHEFRPGRFEGGGMIWLRFRAWLQEIDETSGGVGVVVFEEVVAHRGVTASHCYAGFLAHLTAWGEANKIPYRGVPVGTIKRHVTGK